MNNVSQPSQQDFVQQFVQPHDLRMPLRLTGQVRFDSVLCGDPFCMVQVTTVVTPVNRNWHHPSDPFWVSWNSLSPLN